MNVSITWKIIQNHLVFRVVYIIQNVYIVKYVYISYIFIAYLLYLHIFPFKFGIPTRIGHYQFYFLL